ncbi:MAG: DNA repair protein RecN [Alphaproteobacteria bacterium]|nr:MAG: DNA repair protein RecN [Alphaproteobacteria bacterium]
MLVSLSIRDVVLIDRLDLEFRPGLSALTGETGAGKSILLDALGLALGARGDSGLVRHGADQAVVTAEFDVPPRHPVRELLAEQAIDAADGLVLRRQLGRDGRSRAFVNDQPASIGLLRRLGEALVEIEGQFEARGLLDPATHRSLLDAFGGLEERATAVAEAWRAWRAAAAARAEAAAEIAEARRDEEYLRHAVNELDALDPKPGEETELADQRSTLMHRGKLVEALEAALAELAGDGGRGVESAIAAAQRRLDRLAAQPGLDAALDRIEPAVAALDRAAAEAADAVAVLERLLGDLDANPGRLEKIEERLFALRGLARKHGLAVDDLADLRGRLAERLAAIEGGSARLARLAEAAEAARQAYVVAAESLSAARQAAAKKLDKAVNAELPPLKLEKARFATRLERLAETQWGEQGLDRIAFEVATNPGTPPGALARIASGGELARFMLALKVALAAADPVATLVFDEVDAGVGGATATAVGERLARLARKVQVLVVTHSPQVAAKATHHWRVRKESKGRTTLTRVEPLAPAASREEIARMLAGTEVTAEARAAADQLIGERPTGGAA